MNRFFILLVIAVTGVVVSCQQMESSPWFDGDLDAAQAAAAERDTVVMIQFYTDWCTWCRRLETDTFSVPDVRRQLTEMVSVRRNAEMDGAELAERFAIDSYPTMVFLAPDGSEMDRILGYLPPDKFLSRVERVRAGDTFLARLRHLEENPGDVDAIERSVEGLLERSDPEGAISRIEAFQQATEGSELALSRRLMFAARTELHARVYQRAANLYRSGWERSFAVRDAPGTAHLHLALAEGLRAQAVDDQAAALRRARYDDAADLLEIPDVEVAEPHTLVNVADFAFRNGHYDLAAELYLRWDQAVGDLGDPEILNDVAWRLYLSGRQLEAAIDMAERSFAAQAEPNAADTLARLLYVTGDVEEAVILERRAAREAEGTRGETYARVAQRMEDGEPLEDEPSFESYPGTRRRAL